MIDIIQEICTLKVRRLDPRLAEKGSKIQNFPLLSDKTNQRTLSILRLKKTLVKAYLPFYEQISPEGRYLIISRMFM